MLLRWSAACLLVLVLFVASGEAQQGTPAAKGSLWVRHVLERTIEVLRRPEEAGADLGVAVRKELVGERHVSQGVATESSYTREESRKISTHWETVAGVQRRLKSLPAFLKSSCADSNYLAQLPQMQELGVNTIRVYCNWRYLENTLYELDPSLSVQSLRANTSWIEPYSATLDWNLTDSQVNTCVQNNIIPLVEIGEGTDHCLPFYQPAASGVADPGAISPQLYLAYMYRYCRAVVHRYKDRVPLWQIENELNDAYIEAVGGIRSPHTPVHANNPWGNFTFVTSLLETLYLAVKDEDASLLTTQNVLVGTPENAYSQFRFESYYLDAIRQWQSLMDVVSFDYYPNMFTAAPDNSYDILNKVNEIRSVLTSSATPIMLAETGLVAMNQSLVNDVPEAVQYSDAQQSAVVTSAFTNLTAAGGFGYQLFKTSCNSGFAPPEGGYSSTDIDFLNTVTKTILSNDIDILIAWCVRPLHIPYVLSGRPLVVAFTPPTTSYGVLYQDCSPRPALPALAALYATVD